LNLDVKSELKQTKIRSLIIPTELIGNVIGVYNGKIYFNIRITEDMVGYKLGEFSFTRRLEANIHKKKDFVKKK